MPADPHAVSACLPLWSHNIGYEEGDAAVHEKLQAAYPRFCFHPLIRQLSDKLLNDDQHAGLPFVSTRAARRAVDYLRHYNVADARTVPLAGGAAEAVVAPKQHFPLLKQYWQHAGENLSSRAAEAILDGRTVEYSETASRTIVRRRVAGLHGLATDSVFLCASGMAAIAASWRVVRKYSAAPSAQHDKVLTCQFGFPYVDTLKIQQRFPQARHLFYPIGDEADLNKLAARCAQEPPAAVFCEVPTNPLLFTPDLSRLRTLADQYKFLLVVDDTLGACCNLDVLPYADMIVTSLTKYFSGYGNVLAGSLVVNSQRPHAAVLQQLIENDFEETLSDADAEVLARNSEDLHDRVRIINDNAAALAKFLEAHDAVDNVCYPVPGDRAYEQVRRSDGGYGGLLSFVLKDAATTTPPVFDALRVCKGPNLGTNFTLCCPYTILAHYDELEFVESCGVSRWLLRVSTGTESSADLISRFDQALAAIPVG